MDEIERLLVSEDCGDERVGLFKSRRHQIARFKASSFYSKLKHVYLCCLHLILVTFLVYLLVWLPSQAGEYEKDIYSKAYFHFNFSKLMGMNLAPITNPLRYITKTERQHEKMMQSAYTGWPTEQNNRAWEELIRRMLFQMLPMQGADATS